MAAIGFARESRDSPTSVSDGDPPSITRRFIVEVQSAADGTQTVLGAPGLPQRGFVLDGPGTDFNAYMFCQERSASRVGRSNRFWHVDCIYRPYNRNDKNQQRKNNPTGDPLFDLPRIRLETVKRQVDVVKDIDGDLIANPFGSPYLPHPQKDQSYKRLTIVRHEPIASPIVYTMKDYLDYLNDGEFWGEAKWFWKMQDIGIESATRTVQLEDGPVYYAYLVVTYVLEGKKPIGDAESGWDLELLNYGPEYLTAASGGKKVRFRLEDGTPYEWFLDTDGTRTDTPTYTNFEIYDEADFDALQLPQSFFDAVDDF